MTFKVPLSSKHYHDAFKIIYVIVKVDAQQMVHIQASTQLEEVLASVSGKSSASRTKYDSIVPTKIRHIKASSSCSLTSFWFKNLYLC